MAPRMAVRGDSVYVAWHVVDGDRTTLYFDNSPDGGATWNQDQVIFDRKALSVQASLQPFDSQLLAGWVETQTQTGRTNRQLSYRLYSPAGGWTAPKGERDSLAGDHGPARFYYGFDLLPWKQGCLVAYSKGALGLSPEIYLAWSSRPEGRLLGTDENKCAKKRFRASLPSTGPIRRERDRRGLQPAEGPPIAL